MMSGQHLLFQSATTLARRIRQKDCTSLEVVEAHVDRAMDLNDRLHAMVQFSPSALEDARAADAEVARGGNLGPLHGVPITLKDWLETQGLISSSGYEHRKDFVPRQDATAVRRLREAGAIIIGKSKSGVLHDLYPVPRNPFDPSRTPGSSSGGEAALLASGGTSLGLGSDSGGSLRWPAHCCGVAAFKPSNGLVPLTGHYPPILPLADPRTVVGPLARHVEDLALTLDVIRGPDGRDPSALPLERDDQRNGSLEGLRVAWFDSIGEVQCDEDTGTVLSSACRLLSEQGSLLSHSPPPRLGEAMAITEAYWARPESVSYRNWRPYGKSTLTADQVEQSLFEWDRFRMDMLQFMGGYDLLICPVAETPAPNRLSVTTSDYAFTVPFSLTGQPVLTLRGGTDADGLPIGLQLVGRPYDDQLVLKAGLALESALKDVNGPWPRPD